MLTVLENQVDAIKGSREVIASLLPDLWNSLHPIFDLSESSESNTYGVYSDGVLGLSSAIDLKIGNQDRVRTSRDIRESITPLNLVVIYSLNNYSVVFNDNIDMSIHVGIPYIFMNFRINIKVNIDKFDEYIMGNAYFNFILKHGLISMNKGIISVSTDNKEAAGKTPKTPTLYSGLYEDK